MWLIGLLIGMVLGGISGSGSWTVAGGILGLACGLIYDELSRKRNNPLEKRVEALEKMVRQLSAQIAALKSVKHPVAQAQPSTDIKHALTVQTQPAIVAQATAMSVEVSDILHQIKPAKPFETY